MNSQFWGSTEGWIAIAGLAIGTFLIRYSFIGFFAGKRLPPKFERALQLAVPAIFAAIVVPLVVMSQSHVDFSARWPHVVAAVVTAIVAWWRGGMMTPIISGMMTLYLIEALFR